MAAVSVKGLLKKPALVIAKCSVLLTVQFSANDGT